MLDFEFWEAFKQMANLSRFSEIVVVDSILKLYILYMIKRSLKKQQQAN